MDMLLSALTFVINLMALGVYGGLLYLLGQAMLSVAQNKQARWSVMVFIGTLLVVIPSLLREYPPLIARAIRDSYQTTAPILDELQLLILQDIIQTIEEEGGFAPVPVPDETVFDIMTATPPVLPTATPDVLPQATMPAAATPISTPFPTATGTPTPVPTLDLSIWNVQTPAPTPLIYGGQ